VEEQTVEQVSAALDARAAAWAPVSGIGWTLLIVFLYALIQHWPIDAVVYFRDEASQVWLQPTLPGLGLSLPRLSLLALDLLLFMAQVVVVVAGAFVAASYLGRMYGYGQLHEALREAGLTPNPHPGHFDGAAGLAPIGKQYFYQAMVAALPALFFATWWYVWRITGFDTYWTQAYIVLLAIALAIEVAVFVAPMWSIHREMGEKKALFLTAADELGKEAITINTTLADGRQDDGHAALRAKLAAWSDRYVAIQQMPTWPADARTRRWFTINNIALFFPVISVLLNLNTAWQKLLEALGHLFGGG
jgi:hypothetical protein